MRPERMRTIQLLCKKEDSSRVIEILADLKAVHLTDHQRQTVGKAIIDIGTPRESAERLSSALIATRNLLAKTESVKGEKPDDGIDQTLDDRIIRTMVLAEMYSTHEQELAAAEKSLQRLDLQLDLLDMLAPLESPVEAIFAAKSVQTIVVRDAKPGKRAFDIKSAPHVILLENHRRSAAMLVVQKQDAQKTKDLLLGNSYELVDISPLRDVRKTPKEATARIHAERAAMQREHQRIVMDIANFNQQRNFLLESEPIFAFELLKAQAPLHFGATKHVTLVGGFIPEKRAAELERRIKDAAITALVETSPARQAPVALDNPRYTKDFEWLLRLYSLPRYDELDPTRLLALTFPVFFGFMLGDIGYGLCALAVFMLLKAKMPKTRQLMNIFIISAVSTIIFGFVYGEFFGVSSILGAQLPMLIHRAEVESIRFMFTVALCIGLFHINLGLLLGAVDKMKDGLYFVIIEKGCWLLVEIGLLTLADSIHLLEKITLFSFGGSMFNGFLLLGIGGAGLWHTEKETGVLKVRGIIEIPMMASNMLSYIRLVAIGLASVYLAFIINQQAGLLFAKGGLALALGVVILVLGHALNLALGLLGPFLHSLRLHYVEFFTKFYEGGGVAYRPFGAMEES